MKKIFTILVSVLSFFTIYACKPDNPDTDDLVEVGMAVQNLVYEQSSPYKTEAKNKTYNKGDVMPIYESIGEKLGIKFVNNTPVGATKGSAIWEAALAQNFEGIDMVNPYKTENAHKQGMAGKLLNLSKYMDKLPNLKAFLDSNLAAKQTVTASDGNIYSVPGADGLNELRILPIARVDWIKDILDAENTDAFDSATYTVPTNFEPLYPDTKLYQVTVTNTDGTTRTVTKTRTENIITTLRNLSNPTGKTVADAFRNYIKTEYGDNSGYAKWSDVFAGTDASYDMDEFVALMYVIQANSQYILRETNGKVTTVDLWFPRTDGAYKNMYQALDMFGIRAYTYIDTDGTIKDPHGGENEDKFINTINNISNLYKDGLIAHTDTYQTDEIRQEELTGDTKRFGFFTVEYVNSTINDNLTNLGKEKDSTMQLEAILPPVNNWFGDDEWFSFSSEVRTVGGSLSVAQHVENDETKLNKILELINGLFDFSKVDSIGTTAVFGPKEWLTGESYIYNGTDIVWERNEIYYNELQEYANGHLDTYVRKYLGYSPNGVIRTLGMEYETLNSDAKNSINKINTATQGGSLRLLGVYDETDTTKASWYKLLPTSLPFTELEINAISNITFKGYLGDNTLVDTMKYGFSSSNPSYSEDKFRAMIDSEFANYIKSYNDAYNRLS